MALWKPTPEELSEILAKHRLWLESGYVDGARADLAGADLARADLARANLAGADLARADLAGAYLAGAYLAGADLAGADLARADLARANLAGADLAGADLAGAKHNDLALALTEIVPREGSFVGWKKCRDGLIVKLRITEDAKRSNATGRKCRASKAEVLEITSDGEPMEEATSTYDSSFVYNVGDVLEVPDFEEDRLKECAPGIHFYLTPEEAKAHV